MVTTMKRIASISTELSDRIKETWHFIVPVEMTPDAWRTMIDREIRQLHDDDLEFDPEEYISTFTLMKAVVRKISEIYPLAVWFAVEYVDEKISDDRGIGRMLDRNMLGRIEEHNDLIDRRDAANILRINRRQKKA